MSDTIDIIKLVKQVDLQSEPINKLTNFIVQCECQGPQYARWKDCFWFLSSHTRFLIFMLAVSWGSPLLNLDLYDQILLSVALLLIRGVFKKGEAYTCQENIIKLMNIAFLTNSKYSPLLKK